MPRIVENADGQEKAGIAVYGPVVPTDLKGKWYWRVDYTAHAGFAVSKSPYLIIVVLMDGTAVKPVVQRRQVR
jgi:hypothetical protein